MAPAESVDSGGVKLMVMKEHISAAAVPCSLSLSPKRQLNLLDHTDLVKLQEKSPSSVTEVQRFEVDPEQNVQSKKKNENENENSSPDLAPGSSSLQKVCTKTSAPKDVQDTVLKAKDQNTEATLNTAAPSPPTSPSTRRRKDSSIERIEVVGKFKYDLTEELWSFEGEWVFKDPSEEHESLSFQYKFPCADTAKAATETDSKENVALRLPEKTSWAGSFSNQMRRNNKVVCADVAESFDLTVSAVSGTGSNTEYTANGTGRNKFGTFTIAGAIHGDGFNGIKEYYKIREPSGSVALRRRRSRDSKPRDRYEPPSSSSSSSASACPASPTSTSRTPSPKPKPKPKSPKPTTALSEPRSEQKRKKKRGHARSKPCSSSKSRKRPREVLKLKITAPKSNVSKKARARKHIKAYLNAVTAFAEHKAEAKNRSMHTIPTLHAPGVRPRQRMTSRSLEKLRKILGQWNAGNGQCASPANTFFELGYLYKSIERGKLKDKVMNGYGSCAFINGYCYEGEFVKGAMNGRGILSDSAGSIIYQGDFHDNKMHGVGTFFFKNGNRFDGEWREGCISGYGLFKEANGNTYLGEWSKNKRHGLGIAQFSDGSVYDGEWAEDEMHGKGSLHVEGVLDYEGGFKRGQFDGRGQCSYTEGGKYEGMFKEGLKDGRGAYAFSNGALHEGRFRSDRIDGTGFLKMEKNSPVKLSNDDVLVPIACKTEMRFIHLKAGFSEDGR